MRFGTQPWSLTQYGERSADGALCVFLSPQPGVVSLRERLFHAQAEPPAAPAPGPDPARAAAPYSRVGVATAKPAPAPQAPAQNAQIMVPAGAWGSLL